MAINKNIFLHESDKAALDALQSIPGFTRLMKSYMKSWNERIFYIQNMSSFVHINDKQLKKYHDMLPPICQKLGIDVPELFLQLNPYPNSYTSGDSRPFIVMTSGLIETLPERLIPTVLAHECGHIACHHVLYRTMGQMILNGAIFTLLGQGVSALITYPIRAAFYYWMRCSEFSADRAAILCDGDAGNMMEVCARLAGFGKGIGEDINMEAFMEQAEAYDQLIKNNAMNKTLEFMNFGYSTHPLNAIRAFEADKWTKSDAFIKSKQYFDAYQTADKPKEFPLGFNEKHFTGRDYQEVEKELEDLGFNVDLVRQPEKNILLKGNGVTGVSINGSNKYKDGDWVSVNSRVEVRYYKPLSEKEIEDQHPGQIRLPDSSSHYIGKDHKDVEMELFEIGIVNTRCEPVYDLKKENDKLLNKVSKVVIDDKAKFSKGDWIDMLSEVVIYYHDFRKE